MRDKKMDRIDFVLAVMAEKKSVKLDDLKKACTFMSSSELEEALSSNLGLGFLNSMPFFDGNIFYQINDWGMRNYDAYVNPKKNKDLRNEYMPYFSETLKKL